MVPGRPRLPVTILATELSTRRPSLFTLDFTSPTLCSRDTGGAETPKSPSPSRFPSFYSTCKIHPLFVVLYETLFPFDKLVYPSSWLIATPGSFRCPDIPRRIANGRPSPSTCDFVVPSGSFALLMTCLGVVLPLRHCNRFSNSKGVYVWVFVGIFGI